MCNRYIVTIEIESNAEIESLEKYIGREDDGTRVCGIITATKVPTTDMEGEAKYYRDTFKRALNEHIKTVR